MAESCHYDLNDKQNSIKGIQNLDQTRKNITVKKCEKQES